MSASTYDVFISYARADGSRYAEQLDEALKAAGIRAWRNVRDIDPAMDFTADSDSGSD